VAVLRKDASERIQVVLQTSLQRNTTTHSLIQWSEHELALENGAVRHDEVGLVVVNDLVIVEEHIEVNYARTFGNTLPPSQICLNIFEKSEELLWIKGC
jgi:hypothetical protein